MDTRPDNVISELVSLLELDPHGNHNVPPDSTTDDLGVHRGDWVFLHRPGTVNGVPKLRIPRIGELESWVRESPTFHLNGQVAGWRREMSDIGASIASCSKQEVRAVSVRRPSPGDTTFNWFGEVTNVRVISGRAKSLTLLIVPLASARWIR
jgi:ubiquitin-conjugating enzyme E2 O